ncbi:MAG TPA: AI-2E family transporter [Burkholderiales bacterium]|nr:AI-2E family transporter [Burkholderiales bacterium]
MQTHMRAPAVVAAQSAEEGIGDAGDDVTTPAGRISRTHWALVGLFVLAALYTFHFARPFLLPVVFAVLFALLLAPAVGWLKKRRLPEPVGAALVIAVLLCLLGTAIYTLADPAAQWLDKAPESFGAIEARLRKIKQPVAEVQRAADKLESITRIAAGSKPREVVVQTPGLGALLASQTPYLVAGLISTTVLLYFLLASGDLFLRKTVRLIPTLRNKIHAVEVGREIQHELGHYFLTVTVINAGLGIATTIAMQVLGMPNPLLWGAMAMLLNYIPYLGPTTSLVILGTAAAITFDDVSRIWPVPAVFLALVLLEGQLIQPVVVGRRLRLNPVMIFIAFLLLGWLWGIAGMFIAVPVLVTLKVVCHHVEHFSGLGEYLGRD